MYLDVLLRQAFIVPVTQPPAGSTSSSSGSNDTRFIKVTHPINPTYQYHLVLNFIFTSNHVHPINQSY